MNSPLPSSPWLSQLVQERPHFHLEKNVECDIAVVGAGIAGVSTAYYLLKLTSANVLLIDAGRIAHGTTGRNAGQVVSEFERPLEDIVRGFGLEMAVQGQVALESAWGLLDDIIGKCQLRTPLYNCKSYTGFTTIEQILSQLQEKDIRAKAGLSDEPLLIQVGSPFIKEIPADLAKYILEVPHSVILRALETIDQSYSAAEVSPVGCMNSALFCEELVGWMSTTFGDRFTVAEHLPVDDIILGNPSATLKTTGPTITAKRVVLCTNGFENFTLTNLIGPEINTAFHSSVRGCIGYMAGYMDEADQSATAVNYHPSVMINNAYHYLTRRPYERGTENHSLVCIGGPDRELPDDAMYDPTSPFPADIEEELDRDLRRTYRDLPPLASRTFLWQGLMCYTPNTMRRIGFDETNNTLLYNLGCNGIGILPSIYGGKRIAQLLAGHHLAPSIFDPERGDL